MKEQETSNRALIDDPSWSASDPNRPFAQALSCKPGRHNSLARGLFDHLVGAKQNRRGYRKAKRPGGLEVHDHLELVGS